MDSGEDPLTPGPRRRKQRRIVNFRHLHRPRLSLMKPADSSSSSQQRFDYPGAEKTRSVTCVRQSVLYSDRPRRPQRRRPPHHVEHPSEARSSEQELEVTNLSAFEALSVRDTSTAFPSEIKEHPSEVSSSELGRAITDLPTLEPLTLSDPPLLIPWPLFKWSEGIRERGEETLEELADVRNSAELGLSRSEALSGNDSSFSPKSTAKNPTKDSDDKEEKLRLVREYRAAHTYTSLRQAFDAVIAAEHELAIKKGIKLPPPPVAKHLPVHQETQKLQEWQQPSSTAAQPQHSTAPGKSRCEASNAELVENAENWMREEVKMVFDKYIETREDLKELDYCFNDLCHQCFNVENYNKIFHHYNFTVRMKKPNSVDWVVALYFAEVKQIFGRKYYFCCRLETNENCHCYACKSQGMEDLQHPATGGFDPGLPKSS